MAVQTGYTKTQIVLHWLIAALILFNYVFSDGMGKALETKLQGVEPGFTPHVLVGMVVLVLALVRLGVRRASGAPEAPGAPGSLGVKLSGYMHSALYLLMIAVPVSGAVAWFGGVEPAGGGHELVANLLMLLALGHALMALVHQYVLKDHLLRRMMKSR